MGRTPTATDHEARHRQHERAPCASTARGAGTEVPPREQIKELQADCLAGYYLGSLTCRGIATIDDVRATLATACVIADGTGDPIRDLDTHGTCGQRARAVAIGMDAYMAGEAALAACSF